MNFCSFLLVKTVRSRLLPVVLIVLSVMTAAGAREYVRVVDGDSLEIGSRRIRMQGIDAPEYKQYCFDKNGHRYFCGKEARRYLDDLLKKADYNVECRSSEKDVYERELAECFVGGKNLNLEMIRAGWAVVYRSSKKDYLEAEKKAQQYKKGVWQGKYLRPEYYRRLNKR